MVLEKDTLYNALSNCDNGDILLCRGPIFSFKLGKKILSLYPDIWAKGRYTHAGLFDKRRFDAGDEYCIISASQYVQGFKKNLRFPFGVVGYESITRWANEDEVVILRVTKYSSQSGYNTVNILQPFIGNRFLFSSLNNTHSFYCSKLISYAWELESIEFKTNVVLNPFLPLTFEKVSFNFKLGKFSFNIPFIKLRKNYISYCSPNFIAQSDSVTILYDFKKSPYINLTK